MNSNAMKQAVCDVIDGHRDRIVGIGEALWSTPETGFKEVETAGRVQSEFEALNVPYRDNLAVTGVRADLNGGEAGPTLALLGEMDGLILPEHPAADPRTGAVHACGHHAQIAGLLGAAMGLKEAGVMPHVAGSVVFMAVPAEECIELAWRRALIKQGKIGFLGGKQELIRLGLFDDVDLAMMIHTAAGRKAHTRCSMNGFSALSVRFRGRAAHAGSAPHCGVNALNAASLALQAIHAQRETFPDADHVRVHPIITGGGSAVSIVPDDVRVETMIRAATRDAVQHAALRVRRSCHAGALAIGADVEIDGMPGYLPLADCPGIASVFAANALNYVEEIDSLGHLAASTDMGDVTQIMPASHPGIGGADGAAHTTRFKIVDPDLAYVVPAKVLAMSAIDLLADGAATSRRIVATHPPRLSRTDYLAALQVQQVQESFRYLD